MATDMEHRTNVSAVASVRQPNWCSRRPDPGGCSPAIDLSPPPDRPDPAIYSQAPLLAAATTATWDNPDIVLYAAVQHTGSSWRIADGWFLDNVKITVRNRSLTAAAINMVVTVSYSRIGIGLPRTPLTTQLVSLEAGGSRQLIIPLPPAVLAQTEKALALFVDVSHPYDLDATNNHGESISIISLIGAGLSGVIPIKLGNTTSSPITYALSVEPTNVTVSLSNTNVTVGPGATASVTASHTTLLPTPSQTSFTVVARDAIGNLVGGFTSILYFG